VNTVKKRMKRGRGAKGPWATGKRNGRARLEPLFDEPAYETQTMVVDVPFDLVVHIANRQQVDTRILERRGWDGEPPHFYIGQNPDLLGIVDLLHLGDEHFRGHLRLDAEGGRKLFRLGHYGRWDMTGADIVFELQRLVRVYEPLLREAERRAG
jgi:hypothetical protein